MPSIYDKPNSSQAFTVSELNREVKTLLETNFPAVLVQGELTNFSRPSSGHWYFTLKDERAQVRCAMFRGKNIRVRFKPENGSLIQVRARLSLYEGRGDYQLLIDSMEPAGDGALQQAFEALKQKLHAEGLFAPERTIPLPDHPRHIGIITSPTGAAIRDILSVTARRFPSTRLTIIPVPVQGSEAAPAMVRAIQTANSHRGYLADLDALILTRGGGSLEDLWAFNDEALARSVATSDLPVISAVGHEVDFTISDFVADIRAPTPSAAAEMITPSQEEYLALFLAYRNRFTTLAIQQNKILKQTVSGLSRRLRDPRQQLQTHMQRLDELEMRLKRSLHNRAASARNQLNNLSVRLRQLNPADHLPLRHKELAGLNARLIRSIHVRLQQKNESFSALSRNLHSVSPLATLGRGYSICFDEQGNVIRNTKQLQAGETMRTRLASGAVVSTVNKVLNEND